MFPFSFVIITVSAHISYLDSFFNKEYLNKQVIFSQCTGSHTLPQLCGYAPTRFSVHFVIAPFKKKWNK